MEFIESMDVIIFKGRHLSFIQGGFVCLPLVPCIPGKCAPHCGDVHPGKGNDHKSEAVTSVWQTDAHFTPVTHILIAPTAGSARPYSRLKLLPNIWHPVTRAICVILFPATSRRDRRCIYTWLLRAPLALMLGGCWGRTQSNLCQRENNSRMVLLFKGQNCPDGLKIQKTKSKVQQILLPNFILLLGLWFNC